LLSNRTGSQCIVDTHDSCEDRKGNNNWEPGPPELAAKI
jgi:hypothetical protein